LSTVCTRILASDATLECKYNLFSCITHHKIGITLQELARFLNGISNYPKKIRNWLPIWE